MSDLSSSTEISLLLILLIICVLIIHLLIRKRITYLPESVAIIFIGGLFGLVIKFYNQWTSSQSLVQPNSTSPLINSKFFFIVFLPPIIFEQSYHLHKGNFFRNLGTILTFAIFGTTINAMVTGLGLYFLGIFQLSYQLPWRECFIIGALNSAIDPVAILSIFQVLNVDQLLYMLVFGESILNDAVAIVLTNVIVESKRHVLNIDTKKLTAISMAGLIATSNFTTTTTLPNSLINDQQALIDYESTLIENHNQPIEPPIFIRNYKHQNPPAKREILLQYNQTIPSNVSDIGLPNQILRSFKTLIQISFEFILMFYVSGFVGLLFGLTSALLTKYLAFNQSSLSLEISLLLLTAYASYMFAEMFHLSGIMSILVCGLTMSHYTHENLSIVARQSITILFRTIAFLAETCVFIYLGLGIFEYQHSFHPKLISWTIILTLLGRAAHVFPLSFLLNCFRSEQHRITPAMQLIMWFAGLRGAISYALSIHVGQYYGSDEEDLKRAIVTTTLITVLFTIIVLGGLTIPVVKYLRKHSSSISGEPHSLESIDEKDYHHSMMSKTIQFDDLISTNDYLNNDNKNSNDANDHYAIHFANPNQMKGLEKLNEFYIKPLLIRNPISKINTKPLFTSPSIKPHSHSHSTDDDSENDLLIVNQLRNEV